MYDARHEGERDHRHDRRRDERQEQLPVEALPDFAEQRAAGPDPPHADRAEHHPASQEAQVGDADQHRELRQVDEMLDRGDDGIAEGVDPGPVVLEVDVGLGAARGQACPERLARGARSARTARRRSARRRRPRRRAPSGSSRRRRTRCRGPGLLAPLGGRRRSSSRYGFCDDRNDSVLLSWMTWTTMAPRRAPPASQMLRPAWSNCRSCAPNGLISTNVRQSQLPSRPRLWRRLLGQIEGEPAHERSRPRRTARRPTTPGAARGRCPAR